MRLINFNDGTNKSWILILMIIVLGAVLVGCAATKQSRDVELSDFLGIDSSMLIKGKKGAPLLIYQNEAINLAEYDTVIVDPVTVWWGIEANKGMDLDDLQVLADNFYKLVISELSEDYKIVSEPAAHTLRIQLAITNADKRVPFMDVFSSVMPIAAAVSGAKSLATGKHSFVGEANVEGKIIDAHTGELIIAGADSRVGGKSLGKGAGKWADVNNALEYFAKATRYRLCVERGGTSCIRP